MHAHSHDHPDLTKNQTLVMGVLNAADGPLSAYGILDKLRDHGMRAPLQVYRALDKLVAFGLVHRLESLNAFVACSQPDCDDHPTIAFTICEDCGNVAEISDDTLAKRLGAVATTSNFQLSKSVIELRGTCADCRAG